MLKQTRNHTEPNSIETLDLEPAFCHEWNAKESVRIAVLPKNAVGENGTLSLYIVHYDENWNFSGLQACLKLQEIDLVVIALLEAKRRMLALNAPSPAFESEATCPICGGAIQRIAGIGEETLICSDDECGWLKITDLEYTWSQ